MKEISIQHIEYYKKQMKLGKISKTYKGLIEYMMQLRTHLKKNYPEYFVGSFYQGYMNMTYFPVAPVLFKERNLKLAIVFDHQKIQFEIWLSSQNKKIQKEYLNVLEKNGLDKIYIASENPDSIVEMVVLENPDFNELSKITTEVEQGIKKIVRDVTEALA